MLKLPDGGDANRSISRRCALRRIGSAVGAGAAGLALVRPARAAPKNQKWESAIDRGLKWLAEASVASRPLDGRHLPHRDDGAGRNGNARLRMHDHAGPLLEERSCRRRLFDDQSALERSDR